MIVQTNLPQTHTLRSSPSPKKLSAVKSAHQSMPPSLIPKSTIPQTNTAPYMSPAKISEAPSLLPQSHCFPNPNQHPTYPRRSLPSPLNPQSSALSARRAHYTESTAKVSGPDSLAPAPTFTLGPVKCTSYHNRGSKRDDFLCGEVGRPNRSSAMRDR